VRQVAGWNSGTMTSCVGTYSGRQVSALHEQLASQMLTAVGRLALGSSGVLACLRVSSISLAVQAYLRYAFAERVAARLCLLLLRDGGPLPSRKPFYLSTWGQHVLYFKHSAADTVRPKSATASPTYFSTDERPMHVKRLTRLTIT